MTARWFYARDNSTVGPLTVDEIRDHAARKLLRETDCVWQEGSDRTSGVPAGAALDFTRLLAVSTPVPDWLADVAALSAPGPASGPEPAEAVPAWLEDLRLWLALEVETAERSAAVTPAGSGAVPDWLEGWLPPVPAPSPSPTVEPPTIELPAVAATAADPLQALCEASGIDAETGRVLDAEKLRQWKRQHAHAAPVRSSAGKLPLLEAFRQARTAIERWVDADDNRAIVLTARPEEIERRADIMAILDAYADHGAEMRAKLLRHLAFMVGNRRKYYQALAQRG